MWTVKELLDFLQSNNKRGAFLYVNYLNEKQFGINIIKYLDPEKIAICYDSSYRSKSPMKVDDAISLLQQFNENSTVFYHHIANGCTTEYGITRDISFIIEDNIFLLIDKEK